MYLQNEKLADTAYQFRGQIENLCKLLHKTEQLVLGFRGSLVLEHKAIQVYIKEDLIEKESYSSPIERFKKFKRICKRDVDAHLLQNHQLKRN